MKKPPEYMKYLVANSGIKKRKPKKRRPLPSHFEPGEVYGQLAEPGEIFTDGRGQSYLRDHNGTIYSACRPLRPVGKVRPVRPGRP